MGSLSSSNQTDRRLRASATLGVDAAASDNQVVATAVSTKAISSSSYMLDVKRKWWLIMMLWRCMDMRLKEHEGR